MAETFFDKIYKNKTAHTPDVLSCLANLSNDEVFTPPDVVNQMLDMLPQELFCDPNTTFLDPACKTGVFLREIAKRLIVGLADKIPNLQQRIDHIFHKQLYGIAITELTSLLSRRSLYCSKYPNSRYSVSMFDNPEGNVRYRRTEHKWGRITTDEKGKQKATCLYCGASSEQWNRAENLETHAYEFIHTDNPEKILNMKFDVIISNPPYQMTDGGLGGSATPIYDKFVNQSKKLHPHYLLMVIPSRWFSGGRGLDDFRNSMLSDNKIKNLVDYPVSTDCFTGVEIKGGICYFLWDREYTGKCTVTTIRQNTQNTMRRYLLQSDCDTFIRYNEAIEIYEKVKSFKEESFSTLVSTQKPFGFRTFITGADKKTPNSVLLYANKRQAYVEPDEIITNKEWVGKYKIFISAAYGAGEDFPHQILGKPILGKPNTCCTETYLVIGCFNDESTAQNVISYIKTRFFRFMVLLQKNTQHTSKKVYQFVPMQDFSKPWTDEELYAKYNLTREEIDFIESMIKPMGD